MFKQSILENKLSLVLLVFLFLSVFSVPVIRAQVSIRSEYIGNAGYTLKKGDMKGSQAITIQRFDGSVPIAVKMENKRLHHMWRLSVSGMYTHGSSARADETALFDDIKTGNLMLSYMRPLKGKWMMMLGASTGVATDGGVEGYRMNYGGFCNFMYSFNNGIHLGLGGALTNYFGAPALLPLITLSWERDYNPFFVCIKTAYNLDATIGYHVTPAVDLTLIGYNNKISYQDKSDDDNKKIVFTYNYAVIGIQPVFKLSKKLNLSMCAGYAFNKSAQVKERKLSKLFDNLSEYNVDPSPYLSVGLKYNFGGRGH